MAVNRFLLLGIYLSLRSESGDAVGRKRGSTADAALSRRRLRGNGNLASAGDRLLSLRKKLTVSSPRSCHWWDYPRRLRPYWELDTDAFLMAGDFRHPVRDYVVADVAGAALKTIGKARTSGDRINSLSRHCYALKPIAVMC